MSENYLSCSTRLDIIQFIDTFFKEMTSLSSEQIGERVSEARKQRRLTQAELAARLGFSRTTMVAIEKGERPVSPAELLQFSEILGLSVHELLRETHVNAAVSPRFHIPSSASISEAEISAQVENLQVAARRYVELERICERLPRPGPLSSIQTYRMMEDQGGVDPVLAGEAAARMTRDVLGLGDGPATALDQQLEWAANLRIFYQEMPDPLAAVFIFGDEIGACVALNRQHPSARRRWALSHEMGHFLRNREAGDVLLVGETRRQDPAELFAETFTKAFLLPASGILKHLTRYRSLGGEQPRGAKLSPSALADLVNLAQLYEVPMDGLVLRLEDMGYLSRGAYAQLTAGKAGPQAEGRRARAISGEPSKRSLRFPNSYISLAFLAYEEEFISEGDLAEYLELDRISARLYYQESRQFSLSKGDNLVFDVDIHSGCSKD